MPMTNEIIVMAFGLNPSLSAARVKGFATLRTTKVE